mgnify:CR=1 FL=1
MPENNERPMQDMVDRGNLSLQVTSTIGLLPVENARISRRLLRTTADGQRQFRCLHRRWNGVWMQSRQTAPMRN